MANRVTMVKRETSSFVFESDIIGREDNKNEIVSLLRQSHENQLVSVVAIVGIGGLGKTTLAQLVYNDGEVTKFFEKSMWVCVSDNFDVKTIVRKMLESLTKSQIDNKLSLENMQNMLRDNLTGKRYLLVLDDIWNDSFEKWSQLRTYFMCGAQGSKVVVTTRSKIVAQTMGVSTPYVLNGLTPEKSWGLLKNIITYGDETKGVKQTLQTIGKKIVEKCSGVPLAIRTLGGVLQGKIEEKEWIDVLEGDFWKLCEDEESIMPVLKLSYQNLSPQQKQCFSYCSLYPKDWEIEKDELIRLWMAQGYLECSSKKHRLEDIGNQFVKIFLMKSFFQDVENDDCGDIHRFKMHDLIHDLAMEVAGNDCCYLDSETKRIVGSPMHVMLEGKAIGLLQSVDASRMRTLIVSGVGFYNEKFLSIISKFKYLRVLKLAHCYLNKLGDSIVNLKHLRYLKIWWCSGVGSFFKSITNIVCLQTLILKGHLNFVYSIKDLSNLINLRHLDIEYIISCKDNNTLCRFQKLCGRELYKSVIFSDWHSSLTNIVEISLASCKKLWYLPPMEHLPFLKSFDLRFLQNLEYIYYEEPILPELFFPSLKKLNILRCEKLRGWGRMRDDVNDDDNASQSHLSFPPFSSRLSLLEITDCPLLTCIPTFPNLDKKLKLINTMVTLEATLNDVGSNCSIETPPLSMLKHLSIDGKTLNMQKVRNGWVQNLTSLDHLELWWLPSQIFLEIGNWFKDDRNYLPSLSKIEFHYCSDGLTSLPDWICKFSSLQHINIRSCRNLASLPEGMPRLAKLQTLRISGCLDLIEECETQTSATWPKIAHIANIILERQ